MDAIVLRSSARWTEGLVRLTTAQWVATAALGYELRRFLIRVEYQNPPELYEPVLMLREPKNNFGVFSIITSMAMASGGGICLSQRMTKSLVQLP